MQARKLTARTHDSDGRIDGGGSAPARRLAAPSARPSERNARWWQVDPRYCQILCLGTLLIHGIQRLHFDVTLASAVTIVGTALCPQWLCMRSAALPDLDMRSPLISSLSLSLILRSYSLWMLALAAAIAVASKFVLRYCGKHVFNPTNLALVAMVLFFAGDAWV